MTAAAFTRALLLLPLVTLALSGCRQVLGVDDFGTKATYTGKTDGYSYVSRVCRDCVDEHCETPAADCADDPACKAQAKCVALCSVTDHDCRGRCSLSTPSTTAMAELTACQAAHCGTSLPAADQCGGSLSLHGDALCDSCLAARCQPALKALSSNVTALVLDQCRERCTCHGDCAAGAPGCGCPGDEDEEASHQVGDVTACCKNECAQSVPDWSCVGSVQSPAPIKAPPLELHLRATEPDFATPVSDLHVQACSDLTGNCELSAPATTGPDGWAELTIPRPNRGDSYFGHLLVTSEKEDYSAPALFYFFPPIRETPTYLVRRMVSRKTADLVLGQVPDVEADWDHKGGIVFSARSCNAASQGIQVISTAQPARDAPPLEVYYFTKDLGVVDLGATETSSSGLGFIANAPPGRHELEARHDGQLVGKYSVSVVAGSLTHVVVEPTELETGP